MVAPADFTPDEDVVVALASRVSVARFNSTKTITLDAGRTVLCGPKEAYDEACGLGEEVVFVIANGGGPTRPIKGVADERRPTVQIRVRSGPPSRAESFVDSKRLAVACMNAIHQNPPTADYCESVSLNSHPTYIGKDEDGHDEWLITVELIVDVA